MQLKISSCLQELWSFSQMKEIGPTMTEHEQQQEEVIGRVIRKGSMVIREGGRVTNEGSHKWDEERPSLIPILMILRGCEEILINMQLNLLP